MAIDPNIPLQAGKNVPQLDVLGTLGKVQTLQNAQLQNKLGTVDLGTKEQALANTNLNTLGGIARAAMLRYDGRTPESQAATARPFADAIYQGVEHAVSTGALNQQTAQGIFDGINKTSGIADLVARAQQFSLYGTTAETAYGQVYGQRGSQTDNQSVQYGNVGSGMRGNIFTPVGAPVQQFPSLDALSERVQIGIDEDPNSATYGAPIYGTKAAVTPGNLGGPAASAFQNGGRINVPGALLNPKNAPPPVTGETKTGLGPVATADATARGAAAQKAFQQLSDEGVAAKSQDAMLADMMAEADKFTTGFGQNKIKQAQAFLVRFTPDRIARLFGASVGTLAANEGLDKIVAQISNAQGAGSDARMSVNQAGNPSSTMSPEGFRTVVSKMRGNADYLQARATLAAKYPNKTNNTAFEQEVAKKLDPRVFQYMRLTEPQRIIYAKGISEADQPAFADAYVFAKEQGLLNVRR